MAVIYEIKERRLIPNWRDYKRTLQIGELFSSNRNFNFNTLDISEELFEWNLEKNIGSAADLINSSFVTGINEGFEIKNAANFILEHSDKSSKTLNELSKLVVGSIDSKTEIKSNSNNILELELDTIEEFNSLINNKVLYKVINKTKNKVRNEILNPIVWIELARLYSMNGQYFKAEKAILSALHLAPNNRFVLRSATRFFIHNAEFDKAIYYLKKSENIKNDPWLISAHIATSSIMKRYSPFIKTGIALTASDNFSNFETTELLSSLGTLEFNAGSFKNAKKYFEKSMLCPNDNSLAQLEWISKDDSRFKINPLDFGYVKNPFEAYALDNYEKGNWEKAFYNCLKWFLDMPFSKRPILLGSYIAGTMLNDLEAAIILCKVGLQANPNNDVMLNNLVYYQTLSGNSENYELNISMLSSINLEDLPDSMRIVIQATLGLVFFRQNQIERGKKLYELAILNAKKIKNNYLEHSAIINYTRELINSNEPEMILYKNKVKEMKIDKHQDLLYIRNKLIKT